MANGTIKIKLRPIKLAFLVDPSDKAALLEAIEINTFLWGGVFNPIIPVFQRTPRNWQARFSKLPKAKSIIAGYLDAYDPDFVVPVGKCSKQSFEIGKRKIISTKEILEGVIDDRTPKYGVSLFEVLNYFIHQELRFIRRDPLEFIIPDFGKPLRPFIASVFGALPKAIDDVFCKNYSDPLNSKKLKCNVSNYADFLKEEYFFLRRLCSLYIRPLRLGSWRSGRCIFFLDGSNPSDVIDYWNLRAIGWNVIPVPKQAANIESTKKLVLEFIEENFFPNRFNPQIYHNTTILKGRSTKEDDVKQFIKSLDIPSAHHAYGSKVVLQPWYPRIWDEWARDKDGVECCELDVDSKEYPLSGDEDRKAVKTLDPKFIGRFGGRSGPRFANDVEIRFYGGSVPIAEVIPEGGDRLVKAIGGIGSSDGWRFSKKGMVYFSSYPDRTIHFSLPKAEDMFREWLRERSWELALSSPGRIARQMLKQLGGILGVNVLADEGMVKLLGEMSDGKTKNEDAFLGELSKIANQRAARRGGAVQVDGILKRVVDLKMFRLGMEIQCPICGQHSWYSVREADYELQCLKCLDRFRIPAQSKEIKWSYRTFGPFSLPNQAHGVYSVLLTLRFFAQLLDGATTPITSFTAMKDGKTIEADLGLLFQESEFGRRTTEVIFAECKTYNHFQRRDVERMAYLAGQFPGAIIVFATLRSALTDSEKKFLRPFVNRCRKYWKAERPSNPVLILTGVELFATLAPPYGWKDIGGIHASFAENEWMWRDLLRLCDVTQQIYLDMKPWHEWLEERWRKGRHRRKKTGSMMPELPESSSEGVIANPLPDEGTMI